MPESIEIGRERCYGGGQHQLSVNMKIYATLRAMRCATHIIWLAHQRHATATLYCNSRVCDFRKGDVANPKIVQRGMRDSEAINSIARSIIFDHPAEKI